MIRIVETRLAGVLLVEPDRFHDGRGFFSETYSKAVFAEAGFTGEFIQDNHARSAARGTIRGLHFQAPPYAQDKLVRVVRGAVLDVAVDIRRGAATYGQWVAEVLSEDNWRQLLVPQGFAHGYCALTDECEVLYKVTAPYAPQAEGGIAWNDPSLRIDWPVGEATPALSAKDLAWPGLADFVSPFD